MTEKDVRFWPLSLQRSLLRAAFLSGDAGRSAWEAWKSQVNMEDYPDPGSFQLLPQVYRNLQNQGIDDPLLLKLKGIARQTWFRNQRHFLALAPHLHALKSAGIEVLILGGTALSQRRPDYIVDAETVLSLLVRSNQAVAAMKQLSASGWKPATKRLPEFLLKPYVARRNMRSFLGPNDQRLLLCWAWLPGYPADSVWTRAEVLELHNVAVSVLSPTDQILHVCALGRGPAGRTLFRRAIDVMLILHDAQGDIDWERVINQGQQPQLQPCISETLSYIQQELDAPLPHNVLIRLCAPTPSPLQTNSGVKSGRLMIWPRLTRLWSSCLDYLR